MLQEIVLLPLVESLIERQLELGQIVGCFIFRNTMQQKNAAQGGEVGRLSRCIPILSIEVSEVDFTEVFDPE